ncbi:MAG: RimK-like protein [Phycisphaerae bacterium]|nr:RimK-like protein [Phycisphaerae bacterium]MDD5381979.1 RimK-like protein [Phycisphaerae bacterium]
MSFEVLLLTSLYDFSADMVVLRLKDLEISCARVNREDLPNYRFTVDPVKPSLSVVRNGELLGTSKSLRAIWFRQPVFLRNTPPNPLSSEDQLLRSQWSAFLRALSIFEGIRWMNWPQATYLAESKPYQLMVAWQCGFKVPSTLVGNDCEQFKKQLANPVIVKSLDTVLIREGNDCLFTYTTECDVNELTDESIASAPLIVQQCIEPKVDCRITVVGDHVWAVRILEDGIPVKGDWRKVPKERLQYIDFDLPLEVKESCKNLVRKLGLAFGAIDLLETGDDFVFLEINPTGEWGWLNSDKRCIDLAVAEWLARGNS